MDIEHNRCLLFDDLHNCSPSFISLSFSIVTPQISARSLFDGGFSASHRQPFLIIVALWSSDADDRQHPLTHQSSFGFCSNRNFGCWSLVATGSNQFRVIFSNKQQIVHFQQLMCVSLRNLFLDAMITLLSSLRGLCLSILVFGWFCSWNNCCQSHLRVI